VLNNAFMAIVQRRAVLALVASGVSWMGMARSAVRATLRMLVPAPPGGTTDLVARLFAEALHATSGTAAVVDNKAGVGGVVATDALLSAPAAQPTLLVSPNSLVTEIPYSIKLAHDPFSDLVPLAELAQVGLVLVTRQAAPFQSVDELVAHVKAGPGQHAYASFGPGTISHIKALQFSRLAGLDMLHVGYKGSPPALVDVVGGRVLMMFDGIPTSVPLVKARKLKALAVTSSERSPLLPDVPTFAELGMGSLTQTIGITLFAAAALPAQAAAELRADALRALGTRELADGLAAAGMRVASQEQTQPALKRQLRREYDQTGETLRRLHAAVK
jgi:tripartite-type tricarboxylate transporter receptor subunit TctC